MDTDYTDITGVINNKAHRAYTETKRTIDSDGNSVILVNYFYKIEGKDRQSLSHTDFLEKLEYLEKNG